LKILLRDRRTGLFYSELHQWTSDPEAAHDFKRSSAAIQHAIDHHWPDAEVIYHFGETRESISLPVHRPSAAPGSGEARL